MIADVGDKTMLMTYSTFCHQYRRLISCKNGTNYLAIFHSRRLKDCWKVIWFKLCLHVIQATTRLLSISKSENGTPQNIQCMKYFELLSSFKKFCYSGWKMYVWLLINCSFSDAIQINGVKLLGNASEASMEHLKAMERRAINFWGEATGKTIPLRLKKVCMYNVSMLKLLR